MTLEIWYLERIQHTVIKKWFSDNNYVDFDLLVLELPQGIYEIGDNQSLYHFYNSAC